MPEACRYSVIHALSAYICVSFLSVKVRPSPAKVRVRYLSPRQGEFCWTSWTDWDLRDSRTGSLDWDTGLGD